MKNFQLTKNFSFYEVINTSHKEIDNSNINEVYLNNAKNLAINVLQPLRDFLGTAIIISSWFRNYLLNKKVKGSKTSEHKTGSAADLSDNGKLREMFFYIKNNLIFNQLIYETNKDGIHWIHVSYKSNGINKKEVLVSKWNDKNKKYDYIPYNDTMSYIIK